MKRQQRTILLVTLTVILIPILVGLTPLNFAHKLGKGCPLHPVKNALNFNLCQNYFSAPEQKSDSAGLVSVPEGFCPGMTSAFVPPAEYQPIHSSLSLKDPPLRC
jgi:hypothetical protein